MTGLRDGIIDLSPTAPELETKAFETSRLRAKQEISPCPQKHFLSTFRMSSHAGFFTHVSRMFGEDGLTFYSTLAAPFNHESRTQGSRKLTGNDTWRLQFSDTWIDEPERSYKLSQSGTLQGSLPTMRGLTGHKFMHGARHTIFWVRPNTREADRTYIRSSLETLEQLGHLGRRFAGISGTDSHVFPPSTRASYFNHATSCIDKEDL